MRVLTFVNIVIGSIENALFEECDVQRAIVLQPEISNDLAIKYFVYRRFMNDNEKAILSILSGSTEDELVMLLLARVSSIDSILQTDKHKIVQIMEKICTNISLNYFDNPYNFREMILLSEKGSRDYKDVLINLWSKDTAIIERFYFYIDSGLIQISSVMKELRFLAYNKNPRAYGILGNVFYYGIGIGADIDKAMDFFKIGMKLKDPKSIVGCAKIYSEEGKRGIYKAIKYYRKVIAISGDPEAYYNLYEILIKTEISDKDLLKKVIDGKTGREVNIKDPLENLRISATYGYLPAVSAFAKMKINIHPPSYILHSFISVSQYSPVLFQYEKRALQAYMKKDYKKSALLYLFLSEFKLNAPLENAIYILEKFQIFENQDSILFSLYREINDSNKEYGKKIGDCYYYGTGAPQNYKDAFSFYLASIGVSQESIYNVAYMFENGLGVNKDLNYAYNYIENLGDPSLYLVKIYAKIRLRFKKFLRLNNLFYIGGIAIICSIFILMIAIKH